MNQKQKHNLFFGIILFFIIITPVNMMLFSQIGMTISYLRRANENEIGTWVHEEKVFGVPKFIQILIIEFCFFCILCFFAYSSDDEQIIKGKRYGKNKS